MGMEDGQYSYVLMEKLQVNLLALPLRANFNRGLGRRELSVDLQQYLAGQLFDCLNHFHKVCELVHCDLKLENIMINKDFGLSLIDFDFSRKISEAITDNLGTPGYQAPEMQYKNPSYHGAPVDIFAIGVILYALDIQGYPFNLELNSVGKKYQPSVTKSRYEEMKKSYLRKRALRV